MRHRSEVVLCARLPGDSRPRPGGALLVGCVVLAESEQFSTIRGTLWSGRSGAWRILFRLAVQRYPWVPGYPGIEDDGACACLANSTLCRARADRPPLSCRAAGRDHGCASARDSRAVTA